MNAEVRAVLLYLDEHGPSTEEQAGAALPPMASRLAGGRLLQARREGWATVAGTTPNGSPRWAPTPEGCAWLDAHDQPETAAEAAE